MKRTVTLVLTLEQAEALVAAAENSIGDGTDRQDRLAVLIDDGSIRAGRNALAKLWKVIADARRGF